MKKLTPTLHNPRTKATSRTGATADATASPAGRDDAFDQLRLFAAAVNQADVAIVITTPDLDPPGPKIVFVNPGFTALTGYTADEVLGKTPRILQGPRTQRDALDRLRTELAKGRAFQAEALNYRKDGSEYWVEWRIDPIRGEDNEITHFVSIQRDVTPRKQAEVALRESEGSLRAILNTAADAVIIIDEEGTIEAFNLAAERIFAYTAQEAIGKNVAMLMPHPYSEEYEDYLNRYLRTGKAQMIGRNREVVCRRKNGSTFPADLSVSEVIPDGRRRFTGIIRDITDRVQAQRILREERDFAESLIDTARAIVLVLDNEGCIVRFNPFLEELSGYHLDEVRGKDWFTTFLPEHCRRRVGNVFTRAVGGKPTKGHVNPILTKNGEEREISWWDKRLYDAQGNLIGLLAIGHDITEQKRLEHEVVSSSTREQQRIGEELHDGVGQELIGLSYLASSLERKLKSRKSAEADVATELAGGLQHAVGQIRALSKGLVPVVIDAAGLMASLKELAGNTQKRYGVDCQFDCHNPTHVNDSVVATQLFRVAQEAVTNAVKHSGARHIVIRLESSDGHVVLSIHDDGIGFQPDRDQAGGVGLHIMNYRAGAIGAVLTILPADGGGTAVTCTLEREEHGDKNLPDDARGEPFAG